MTLKTNKKCFQEQGVILPEG